MKAYFLSIALIFNSYYIMAQEDIAIFGGGCFWCTEAIFLQVKGVKSVKPGYSGGTIKNPSYKEVCTGRTGHAEVIEIVFDSDIVSYNRLLEVFFETHDATTLNRQGNDIGTQYRSVVFYRNNDQLEKAKAYINQLNASKQYSKPLVTTLEPFKAFYEAEKEHWNYFSNNQSQPYCVYVIKPKVDKFKQKQK